MGLREALHADHASLAAGARSVQAGKANSETLDVDDTVSESIPSSAGQLYRKESARAARKPITKRQVRPQSARAGSTAAPALQIAEPSVPRRPQSARAGSTAAASSPSAQPSMSRRPQPALAGKIASEASCLNSAASGVAGFQNRPQSAGVGTGSRHVCGAPRDPQTAAFLSELLTSRMAQSRARQAITARPQGAPAGSEYPSEDNYQHYCEDSSSLASHDASYRRYRDGCADEESELLARHRLPPEWFESRQVSAASVRSRTDIGLQAPTECESEGVAPPLWQINNAPARATLGRHKRSPQFGDFCFATGAWANRTGSGSVQNYRTFGPVGPLWTISND